MKWINWFEGIMSREIFSSYISEPIVDQIICAICSRKPLVRISHINHMRAIFNFGQSTLNNSIWFLWPISYGPYMIWIIHNLYRGGGTRGHWGPDMPGTLFDGDWADLYVRVLVKVMCVPVHVWFKPENGFLKWTNLKINLFWE